MKKIDFFQNQILFKTGDEYANIYDFFNSIGIQYHELFVFCCVIGYKNDRKVDTKDGKEFRSTYLNEKQKTVLFTILLSNPEFNKNVDALSDKDNRSIFVRLLSSYAAGGMEVLIEEVFRGKINKQFIDSANYDDYTKDLSQYVFDQLDDSIF